MLKSSKVGSHQEIVMTTICRSMPIITGLLEIIMLLKINTPLLHLTIKHITNGTGHLQQHYPKIMMALLTYKRVITAVVLQKTILVTLMLVPTNRLEGVLTSPYIIILLQDNQYQYSVKVELLF